jgi:hypothetical protein
MRNSKPARNVKLISIAANGVTIDDLLTDRITRKLKWLNQGVTIGDANLGPARRLLKVFDYLPNFFEHVDLRPIEADGLNDRAEIGS